MTKIDPSLYLANQPKTREPSPDLGKDEFIKILMTQLQNQDPMDPMDDREFISQMATFSSLEQMMNISQTLDLLVESQLISPVVEYSHMIGKEVTYQNLDTIIQDTDGKTEAETEDKDKKEVKAKVVAVSQKDGWAILELDNDEKIYAESVLRVSSGQDVSDNPDDDDKKIVPS